MELVVDKRRIFGDIAEEREEKMKSLCSVSAETERKLREALLRYKRTEKELFAALDYAKSLDFSKSSLKSTYLSHPMRVAMFLLELRPSASTAELITALLHNVPETTAVTTSELGRLFGEEVARGIGALLVDRKAVFASICESYYKKIEALGEAAMLTKLLDKMDNLFVLCLNPDEAVRRDYIAEVRERLLPFAARYNAGLGEYLRALLDDAAKTGFSGSLKDRLNIYQEKQKTGALS